MIRRALTLTFSLTFFFCLQASAQTVDELIKKIENRARWLEPILARIKFSDNHDRPEVMRVVFASQEYPFKISQELADKDIARSKLLFPVVESLTRVLAEYLLSRPENEAPLPEVSVFEQPQRGCLLPQGDQLRRQRNGESLFNLAWIP